MKIVVNILKNRVMCFNNKLPIWSFEKFYLLSLKMKVNYSNKLFVFKRKRFWSGNVFILKDENNIGSITYTYEKVKIEFISGQSYIMSNRLFGNGKIGVKDQNNNLILELRGKNDGIWNNIEYYIEFRNRSLINIDIPEFLIYCAYGIRLLDFQNN